jgi:gliding motility-associated-like protein
VGDCNVTADMQYKCNPSSAILNGPPGFQTYNWWDSSYTNLLGSGQNITLTPAPAINGILHVEVTPFNGFGCSDTLTVKVVNSDPIADAGPDKTICAGGSTTIGSSTVPGYIYSWLPGLYLNDSTISMPVSTPAETTVYVVAVTNPLNGCTHYDTVNVIVNTNPIAAFDSVPDQCFAGNSFHFNNNSAGATINNWSFGDNNSSQVLNPIYSYAAVGSYIIKLVVADNNGCKDSVSQAVAVHPNPIVQTMADTSTCSGKGIQLQSNGAVQYAWSPAANLSCTNCSNPVATPAGTTSYVVKGTNSFGCSAADTVAITVFQPIHISVTPGNTICELQTLNLQALGAQTYSWSPAAGLSSTNVANPVASPNSNSQYQVIGYDGHNCFTDTGYVNITVNPKPTLDLGPDLTLSTGTEYPIKSVFTNGPIVNWQWTPSTGLSCDNCAQPIATIKNSITYHATVTNSYGCTAEDSVTIKAFCLGSQVFIPNAFTPDGDGLNDILVVRAKGIQSVVSFKIYTRWGELVFEKKNFAPNVAAFGWDGKIRGVPAAPEVYVYTVEVICDNYENYMFKGNVSILK